MAVACFNAMDALVDFDLLKCSLLVGLEFVSKLEEELKIVNEKIECLKKEYFFPTSGLVLGQGGVYCGLDDLWLEQAAGYLWRQRQGRAKIILRIHQCSFGVACFSHL